MEIKFNPFLNSLNFGAKSKEVRKADDIMRAATAEFPMMSYTRADSFYSSCKNQLSENHRRASMINQYLRSNIRAMRRSVKAETSSAGMARMLDMTADAPIIYTLDALKRKKIGNCSEAAEAALASLYANCYYNSRLAAPCYVVSVIDKETGRTLTGATSEIDHVFVVSDMGKNKERNIIIDPWFGFADYKTKANERYLGLVSALEKEDTIIRAESKLLDKLRKKGIDYDRKNYIFKEKIFIDEKQDKEDKTLKKLASCKIREKYPNLMLYNRRKTMYGEEK